MDVTQGKLCLGLRTDSADMAATMLMNALRMRSARFSRSLSA